MEVESHKRNINLLLEAANNNVHGAVAILEQVIVLTLYTYYHNPSTQRHNRGI
jgi:hypothetical protein